MSNIKGKWEFEFWDGSMRNSVDRFFKQTGITGENYISKSQSLKVSGNYHKDIRQVKKYLLKKIYETQ